jgi:MOSC domain
MAPTLQGNVVALASKPAGKHTFQKQRQSKVTLVAGEGVEADAHSGATMMYPIKRGSTELREIPNARQVHFMTTDLHAMLAAAGIEVGPGDLGENVTCSELDVLSLPLGTRLQLGSVAELVVTGVRNPCASLEKQYPGIGKLMLFRGDDGEWVRRTGIFAIVDVGGEVCQGDSMVAHLPPEPHQPLPVL